MASRERTGLVTYDAKDPDTKFPPIEQLRPPKGAPNVLIILVKRKTQLLFGGMGRLSENCVLNIKNKSHSVTAEIEVPEKGAEGVIIAQGANIGGWSLYAKRGKLKYCYNVSAESSDHLVSPEDAIRIAMARQ